MKDYCNTLEIGMVKGDFFGNTSKMAYKPFIGYHSRIEFFLEIHFKTFMLI